MRHLMSTALVALIVGALAGATMSGVAQEPADTDPPDDRAFEVAGINADRVDGKHAVGPTYDKNMRRNKLVATNKQGLLPSNIVKPKWQLIRNKPGILADDQIGWGEVKNKPGGFADGVDHRGVIAVDIKSIRAEKSIPPDKGEWVVANCPSGWMAVGGGFGTGVPYLEVQDSKPHTTDNDRWHVFVVNHSTTNSRTAEAFVVCMRTTKS